MTGLETNEARGELTCGTAGSCGRLEEGDLNLLPAGNGKGDGAVGCEKGCLADSPSVDGASVETPTARVGVATAVRPDAGDEGRKAKDCMWEPGGDVAQADDDGSASGRSRGEAEAAAGGLPGKKGSPSAGGEGGQAMAALASMWIWETCKQTDCTC